MHDSDRWHRIGGALVGLGATLAVLWPLLWAEADSFPISSYPMFARPRGQPTLFAAVGRLEDGRERRLPAALVGSSEVLQAKVLIQRAVEQGPAAMGALCKAIAARIAAAPEAEPVRSVEIVRRRYDPVAYFVSGPEPIEQERLSSCTVEPQPVRKARRRRP